MTDQRMTDQNPSELVQMALAGDPSAFSTLVNRYRRLGASVAYGVLGDAHLAADAVQDAFVKAFRSLERLKDPERFVPWFLTIVRSSATDLARKRVRWGTREIPVGDISVAENVEVERSGGQRPGSSGADHLRGERLRGDLGAREELREPEHQLLQEEESTRIRGALLRLPSEYREVLLLKHQEGRSYQEIAALLQTTVRAIESRLFRARQQLAKFLEGSLEDSQRADRQNGRGMTATEASVVDEAPSPEDENPSGDVA